jgi:hypothetical protein
MFDHPRVEHEQFGLIHSGKVRLSSQQRQCDHQREQRTEGEGRHRATNWQAGVFQLRSNGLATEPLVVAIEAGLKNEVEKWSRRKEELVNT